MIRENEFGVFIAFKQGVCISLSIPAQTDNDWKRKERFLDLPLMDEETYKNLVKFMIDAQKIFK